MSKTDASFDAIRGAIRTLWPADALNRVELENAANVLLLRAPSDVAAFAVMDGHPDRDFPKAYDTFKRLYRENSRVWDERTLSFVVCRSSEHSEDDKFYAALETDPLFCRKYVIRARDTIAAQRDELLRLPFLPLPIDGEVALQRPQAAQDLLRSAGVSASFARSVIEPGKKSAERIAKDLREGRESLPSALAPRRGQRLTVEAPRASSRLESLTVEGFRAYRDSQTFNFDAPVIVLYGPNGLGKTSLFDAIDYACTGRIGRLCRTRRTQADFARIATHLDKTPGSGSVALVVKDGSPADGTWKLQRSTGDWTTSWINGQEADRKEVINRLTQAHWVNTTPRQQTLDSLFRATHLFGQDEQELLADFRRASTIPETFISEMLSLQDYSEGVEKIGDVLSVLSKRKEEADAELKQLREQVATLTASLMADAGEPSAESTPLESALEDLRTAIGDSQLELGPLPDLSAAARWIQWLDVLSSQQASLADRMQLAQTLRNQLPEYLRAIGEQTDAQARLAESDRDLSALNEDERTLIKNREAEDVIVRDSETRVGEIRAALEQLRATSEALVQRADLSKQRAAVITERDRQLIERTQIDGRLATTGSAVSSALAERSAADGAVKSHNEEVVRLQGLIERSGQFETDLELHADISGKIERQRDVLRAMEIKLGEAESEVQAAKRAREARESEYRRAIAAQVQIDRLLDEIQAHIHGEACPLCGSKFETIEALRAAIREQRESRSSYSDVTVTYQQLVEQENGLFDRSKLATADVLTAKASLDELIGLQTAVAGRLQEFRDGLAVARITESDASFLIEALRKRHAAASEQMSVRAKAAEESRQRLEQLEKTQSEYQSRRAAVHDRVLALDRSIQDFDNRIESWDAQIQAVSQNQDSPEATLAQERQDAETAAKELDSLLQDATTRRKRTDEASHALSIRKQSLVGRRGAAVAALAAANKTVLAFQQQLRALSLPDETDTETLDRKVESDSQRSTTIGLIAEKARVIQRVLTVREVRRKIAETRQEIETIENTIRERDEELTRVDTSTSTCSAIEALLKRERQDSIERHIAAYGPMITMIQQRLRSVYGFGGVHLEAQGGEARVQVEWRSKNVQVPPTDFFSDSQKQILMLSIFLAGSLRQNWSGFAPVLLDDPVTHFDDLNAYAFVELIRGIVATSPTDWQFIVSTCEQRLFDLMQRKFSRLPSGGAVFYEFLGMTSSGPIVERR